MPKIDARTGMPPIVFLGVAVLVMIGALAMSDSDERPPEPVPMQLADDGAISVDEEGIPWNPEVGKWGIIDDHDRETRRLVPTRSLEFAMQRLHDRSWASLKLDPGFKRLDIPAVMAAPAEHRGEPIEILGRIESIEVVDLFDTYGFKIDDTTLAWTGLVRPRARVHGGSEFVRFLMVGGPDESPCHIGENVKIQGMFFKLHEERVDSVDQTTLWVLAKKVHDSFYVPGKNEIDRDVLATVEDVHVVDDARRKFWSASLFHLIGWVLHDADALREKIRVYRGKELRDFQTHPEKHRYEVVEFQAKVLRIEQHPLETWFPQNAEGDNLIDEIWNVYVTTDGTIPITVTYPYRPTELELDTTDQVRIRAVFYRRWGYRSTPVPNPETGGMTTGFTKAPLFIGFDEIEKIEKEVTSTFGWFTLGVGAFTFVLIMVTVLVLRRDRRRHSMFQETLRSRRQVKRSTPRASLPQED